MGHERHGNGPVPTGRTGTSHETRNGAAAVPTTLTSSPCCRRVRGASCRPSGRGWPAVRAMRNLGPIRVPAYGRMGPSSVHRALEFPEQGAELQGPPRASGLWNFRWLIFQRGVDGSSLIVALFSRNVELEVRSHRPTPGPAGLYGLLTGSAAQQLFLTR
jgi:hypothetical protein